MYHQVKSKAKTFISFSLSFMLVPHMTDTHDSQSLGYESDCKDKRLSMQEILQL